MGITKQWIPWRGTDSLTDTIQAILDTYLFFIPKDSDIKSCLPYIATAGHIINFETPESQADCRKAFEYLLPGFPLLRSTDIEMRAAYVALLLKDFPKARSIKTLDKAKTKQFLQFDDWNTGLLSLVKERHHLPRTRNAELTYVSYEYWKSTLNVSEVEISEIEGQIDCIYESTKLPKETLYKELYVSVTRDEANGMYQIAFFNDM